MASEDLLALLPANVSRQSVILDTNLLVLLITAAAGIDLTSFKRIRSFVSEDIGLLNWLVSQFNGTVTTAYALAEASNLGNALSGRNRDRWFELLAEFAAKTEEAHVSTQTVGRESLMVRFGVTDAALGLLSREYVLLTSEYRLSGFLSDLGCSAVNFNHFRFLWPGTR